MTANWYLKRLFWLWLPGEAHYSLLGQPLQYKPSIRPPFIHTAHMMAKHQVVLVFHFWLLFPCPARPQAHLPYWHLLSPQVPLGVWRGSHGRKAGRKSVSSDLSVGEAGNRKTRGRLKLSEPRVSGRFWPRFDLFNTEEAPNPSPEYYVVFWVFFFSNSGQQFVKTRTLAGMSAFRCLSETRAEIHHQINPAAV